jgi:hypothetical protein
MVRAAELGLLILGPLGDEISSAIFAAAGLNQGQFFLDAIRKAIIPQCFHGSDGGGFVLKR